MKDGTQDEVERLLECQLLLSSLGLRLISSLDDRVSAMLVANILQKHPLLDDVVMEGGSRNGAVWDGRTSDPYLNGEYMVILQLVGVMNVRSIFLSTR